MYIVHVHFSGLKLHGGLEIYLHSTSTLMTIISLQVRLGDYFYYGWGTGIDYEQAASHYR